MLAVALIWTYNIGLEVGIKNKPQFDASEYDEVNCDEIERFNGGLRCMIAIQHEDDNVKIFRGEGSIDD